MAPPLCLEGVERYGKPGDQVLDLGTGSGILAIAAVLLGAKEAVGCDIDPKASRVAAENASYNGIGTDRFRCYTGDINQDPELKASLAGKYDLVVANIIADVIIPLTAVAGEYLKPDGLFLTLASSNIGRRCEERLRSPRVRSFETQYRAGSATGQSTTGKSEMMHKALSGEKLQRSFSLSVFIISRND